MIHYPFQVVRQGFFEEIRNIIISTNAGLINKLDVETGKFKRINLLKFPS